MNERIKALKHIYELAVDYGQTVAIGTAPLNAASAKDVSEAVVAKQEYYLSIVQELIEEADLADAIEGEKAKLALDVVRPMNIEGMMILSTSHVEEGTMKRACDGELPVITKDWSDEGAIIFVPSDQDAWNTVASDNTNMDVPDDLFACMEHARAHGCAWLLLDADGPKVSLLQQYEW